jgi:hypothetical protein
MRLPYSTFLALMSCVMMTRVADAVNKRRRKMNMSLNQHPALPKHTILTKFKPFYAYSTGKHHRAFARWYWWLSSENVQFQLNNCQVQISLKKLFYTGIQVFIPYFCRLEWRMHFLSFS